MRFESSISKILRFATELVLISMGMLPSVMPPHFNNTYTPIAAAGTDAQVNQDPGPYHFARFALKAYRAGFKRSEFFKI
jgi:hypothetical protein